MTRIYARETQRGIPMPILLKAIEVGCWADCWHDEETWMVTIYRPDNTNAMTQGCHNERSAIQVFRRVITVIAQVEGQTSKRIVWCAEEALNLDRKYPEILRGV